MINLSEYQNEDRGELTVAPADEYPIMLKSFRRDNEGECILYYGEDNDCPYMMLNVEIIEVPGADGYKDFTVFVGLPNHTMTSKKRRECLHKLETIGSAFGIDFFSGDELDPADYEGKATCTAIVDIQRSEQYGDQNTVKQFLVAR